MLQDIIKAWIDADAAERSVASLHRRVTAQGAKVTYNAVFQWSIRKTPGGIEEEYKPALAAALGVPVDHVLRAAAGLPVEGAP